MAKEKQTETKENKEVAEKKETKVKKPSEPKKKKLVRADLSKVDLKQLAQMKLDYKKLALQVRMSKESNTATLRAMRKDIARAATILNSKKEQ